MSLPAGSWVVRATAQISYPVFIDGDGNVLTRCQLRHGASVIGGPEDYRSVFEFANLKRRSPSTALPSAPVAPAKWRCGVTRANALAGAQLVATQVGGFI